MECDPQPTQTMKVISRLTLKSSSCLLLFAAWISQTSIACAQGTAFTYQGRLNANGGPANGTYDFRFRLASDALANNYVGSSYLTNGIVVASGLFMVTMDFGPGILTGSNYWLEVDVRTNNGLGYTTLSPLQPLTPTPYAVFANSSSNLLGVLSAGQLSGTVPNGNLPASPAFSTVTATSFAGSGASVSNVNALTLNGLSSINFWQLGGNNVGGGQFLGSTNNQPVEIWANGTRVLRLDPGVAGDAGPNVIAGSAINFVASGVVAATISGGGVADYFGTPYTNSVTADWGTVGGGAGNAATNTEATVGGGAINAAGGNAATVGGGQFNNATGGEATIGGGNVNTSSGDTSVVSGGGFNNATGDRSAVGGGVGNNATNLYSTVAGGAGNLAGGQYSTVPGGSANVANGTYSFAAGQQAQATNNGAFVWADSQGSPFASTNNDSFNVRAQGGVHFTTGGAGITLDGFPALASGGGSGITIQNNSDGAPNIIEGSPVNFAASGVFGATVGGGGSVNYQGVPYTNSVLADFGTVAGGAQNTAGFVATVSGGYLNTASGIYSTVAGGISNTNDSEYAVIGGGIRNYVHLAGVSTIGGGNQNQIIATGIGDFFDTIGGGGNNFETNAVYSFIGGGWFNVDFTSYSVIGGGAMNTLGVLSRYSVIGGGQGNTVGTNSDHSLIGGGLGNFVGTNSSMSTISGGVSNFISNGTFFGTIGGGTNNFVNGVDGTVAGGESNSATAFRDTVGGGFENTASGGVSTVSGGALNVASGNGSTISGGDHNVASGLGVAILAGELNQASNTFATVVGGQNNVAGGVFSFAAGDQAKALHQGSFVWADSLGAPFASTANDQFLVRARGGVGIDTASLEGALTLGTNTYLRDHPIFLRGGNGVDHNHGLAYNGQTTTNFGTGQYQVDGPVLFGYAGGVLGTRSNAIDHAAVQWSSTTVTVNGTFNNNSDRNAKQDFASVTPAEILAKVSQLPLTEWSYKADSGTRHIGPMAQDFYSAFNVGTDERHIAPIDEGGVALAAIQGLNQEVGELKTENTELKQRLAALEKLVEKQK